MGGWQDFASILQLWQAGRWLWGLASVWQGRKTLPKTHILLWQVGPPIESCWHARFFCSEAVQPAVGGPPTPEVDVLLNTWVTSLNSM